jgi:hypothetical protein
VEPIKGYLKNFQSFKEDLYESIEPFDFILSIILIVNSLHISGLDGAFSLYGYETLNLT